MAAPTFAQAWVKLKNAMKVFDETRKFSNANSPNAVDLLRTYEEAAKAEGAEAAAASAAIQQVFKGGISNMLANPGPALNPLLQLVARSSVVNSRATDPQKQIDDIFFYMANNSSTVQKRAFTRGAFSSGSPYVGNGTISRVTKDEYNLDMEATFPEVITGKVVADQNSGREKGREIWEWSGLPFVDAAEWGVSGRGSGLLWRTNAVNGADSILKNASFGDVGGTVTVPTSIPNWNSSITVNATNYQFDTTNYYQEDSKENRSPKSLQVNASAVIKQALQANATTSSYAANVTINPKVPYYCGLAWNRQVGSASGTLQLTLGSKSVSVTVSAQTGWQILALPTSNQSDLWPKNWNSDTAYVQIDWTRSGGNLLLDRVMLLPYYPLVNRGGQPGTFVLPVSGATAWLLNDTGTITDSETGAIIQLWAERTWGRYFPHATSSPSISEP